MNARLPGFGAVHSLTAPHTAYGSRTLAPYTHALDTVIPAQDSRQQCVNDCISDCMSSGGTTARSCARSCERECGPPPGGGSIGCTFVDNSADRNLCLGAVTLWELAAGADCGVAAGAAGVAGPFIGAICGWGIPRVADQMRSDCPPATLCV
jgi:hypothetical protein